VPPALALGVLRVVGEDAPDVCVAAVSAMNSVCG
jgi:hypothetical protein